ncbi:N-acetylglucosamine-6-phosphate deacetylase [Thalassotalea sp. ND16A]|uniref:N-acetylglucosamine-6-phosphate deacetylase n=1 Tax=Thalassotalea sp. ND16A TaxID=1535422 RepID=UPI00051A7681|nr:N-acetylglucosamine-6-phosphate deacetylase [Thalassotalea sp. ND16A]KGJ88679.1 N-acetylglucosamine-6-phosphate deacetylase [Thalassotalea sp. ND16A]
MILPNQYYIRAKQVFSEEAILDDHFVLITDGIIASIDKSADANIPVFSFDNCQLLPGFLDLHIHGREGCDIMDAKRESIETISTSLAKHGVIGFLGTTVTSTWDNTLAAFSTIGEAYQNQPSGAQVLGAYNEGLFFTEDHKGAHDEKYFLPLSKDNIDAIIAASQGALKVVALAPELPDSEDIIKYLTSKGIKAMLGHTNANYQQTCDALHSGACGGVHVFNGMKGIHHRDPGCAGAVLLEEDAYVEVIADGVHLHPAILQLIYRLKGAKKMGLISDCIVAGGMKDGTYRLGMLDVKVLEGVARTESGSLAGSTLTLEKAIANLISLADIPPLEAVHMASLIPAEFLNVQDSLGSIKVGKRACMTLVDNNFQVQATIIDGTVAYCNEETETSK